MEEPGYPPGFFILRHGADSRSGVAGCFGTRLSKRSPHEAVEQGADLALVLLDREETRAALAVREAPQEAVTRAGGHLAISSSDICPARASEICQRDGLRREGPASPFLRRPRRQESVIPAARDHSVRVLRTPLISIHLVVLRFSACCLNVAHRQLPGSYPRS